MTEFWSSWTELELRWLFELEGDVCWSRCMPKVRGDALLQHVVRGEGYLRARGVKEKKETCAQNNELALLTDTEEHY